MLNQGNPIKLLEICRIVIHIAFIVKTKQYIQMQMEV